MNPSSAENIPETAVGTVPAKPPTRRKKSCSFRIQPPLIVAAAVLAVSVLFFACWGLFANKSIKGTWTLHFLVGEQDCSVSYSFEEDGTCYFHNGGYLRKGTYQLTNDDKGNLLTMTFLHFSDFNTPAVTHQFRYTVEGTAFSTRKIICTDISGMIFAPDTLGQEDDESVAQKKASADYVETDGYRYYMYTLHEDKNYTIPLKPIEGATQDKDLLGVWMKTYEDASYDHTYAFYDDNTLQITYRDSIYKGCYTAKDGECIFNIAQVDGTFANYPMTYTFDTDGALTITVDEVPIEYTKTDRPDAFDTGIK